MRYSVNKSVNKYFYLNLVYTYIIKNLKSIHITNYTQRTQLTLRRKHVKIGVT